MKKEKKTCFSMSLLVCLVFFSLWFTGDSVQHFEIIKKTF